MISTKIKNVNLKFETNSSNFSPNNIDIGTLAMLSAVDFLPDDKILDLGYGYGVVGILAAKLIGKENVIMCDIADRAYVPLYTEGNEVSEVEIRLSDGFQNIPEEGFTMILSNPPYHADFSVPKHFIEGGLKS